MYKYLLLVLFLRLSGFELSAQRLAVDYYNDEPIYEKVEEMPQFPGGLDKLKQFLSENISYPDAALLNETQGTVYLSFIVGKEGDLFNFNIIYGRSPELDEEAIRVVKLMPKWDPGRLEGSPVFVRYKLPIKFKL